METERSLAAHGAQVVGAARDLKKAQTATAQVRKEAAAHDAVFGLMYEGVRGYAVDPKNSEALWAKSEELVGERF